MFRTLRCEACFCTGNRDLLAACNIAYNGFHLLQFGQEAFSTRASQRDHPVCLTSSLQAAPPSVPPTHTPSVKRPRRRWEHRLPRPHHLLRQIDVRNLTACQVLEFDNAFARSVEFICRLPTLP
jgi:hypothetical protein